MHRPLTVLGAPSNLGSRPYDDGVARHLDTAPRVLRERGLVNRMGAIDLGDALAPAYRDFVRRPGSARNLPQVVAYSRRLADRVAAATDGGRFTLVLGGDCSIVLGCLLGARRRAKGPIGLAYLDAHADFDTPEESRTGSVARMSLGFASGHGGTPLAHLGGRTPLVDTRHVALLLRRDTDRAPCGDLDTLAGEAVSRVSGGDACGFWIHVDADVLNPAYMAAVDSPESGGPTPDELVAVLKPLVEHPLALGLDLATYDPALDPDRSCARRLVGLLESVFRADQDDHVAVPTPIIRQWTSRQRKHS